MRRGGTQSQCSRAGAQLSRASLASQVQKLRKNLKALPEVCPPLHDSISPPSVPMGSL